MDSKDQGGFEESLSLGVPGDERRPVGEEIVSDKQSASEALEHKQEKTFFVFESEKPEESVKGDVATVGEPFYKRSEVTEQVTQVDTVTSNTDELQVEGAVEENVKDTVAEECPVCTETYETCGDRGRALLNCDHTVCQRCLIGMMECSADGGRVSCPLCRQRTPLPQWDIRRMQEEALYLMATSQVWLRSLDAPPQYRPFLQARGRSELESRLESRVEMALVCGCCRYPTGLMRVLQRLRNQCPCCYLAVLSLLYLAELSCFFLVFLPILVLVLLFSLTSK